jgi:signal transduction histidine kinase
MIIHNYSFPHISAFKRKYFFIAEFAICITASIAILSCGNSNSKKEVDLQNEKSYYYHYRNLDSTEIAARRALNLSKHYGSGKAEAYNNLAFVNLSRMNYKLAEKQLDSVSKVTNNQIELLVADVQMMRLCQRKSRNKDFYNYNQSAQTRINRIISDDTNYSEHEVKRIVYARTEYDIVSSTYFYYVGLEQQSRESLSDIDPNGDINKDTAQLINYFYNIGSGGIITGRDKLEIKQEEFNYLIRCYVLSSKGGYTYFIANALQALSEHLIDKDSRERLISNNMAMINYVNIDDMPEDLIAGNFAWHSLDLFKQFGDAYQIAGSYRTLAECYWSIKDYKSALICLNNSLNNKSIDQAPDLVASIREQFSLTYSALNEKQKSDYNRNIYLDLQEKTRQDRQLEARVSMIQHSSKQLNIMIFAVVAMIIIVIVLLIIFDRMRRQNDKKFSLNNLLKPLNEWKNKSERNLVLMDEEHEQAEEEYRIERLHMLNEKKRNMEQRAKVLLSNSIMPLIDRMINEVDKLSSRKESDDIRQERIDYIKELTEKINDYNSVLTNWIQMRQGSLSLRIESFKLQPLFEIVKKERMEFALKGLNLKVIDTSSIVKADQALTLFMINTIADNAKKFTQSGGYVIIRADEKDKFVEISIEDSGVGLSEEETESLFGHSLLNKSISSDKYKGGHGFGLMNCKGIIEKYRKISDIFQVCDIGVDSKKGHGSRFFFKLPKGIKYAFLFMMMIPSSAIGNINDNRVFNLDKSRQFADSAYFSNLKGNYSQTLSFADSCINYLNRCYLSNNHGSKIIMHLYKRNTNQQAELIWFENGFHTSYNTILDVRNEAAVAALALHDWDLYEYNNTAYTSLFRKYSADNKLPDYVKVMQNSESNKNISIILLILLLFSIFPGYYLLYYRNQLYYQFCLDKVNRINDILLSDMSAVNMIKEIDKVWNAKPKQIKEIENLSKLNDIVYSIKQALKQDVEAGTNRREQIELVNDECRRVKMESDNLYVSNSVLDNCLSSLKHETMYYPSRICQLVENNDVDMKVLMELLSYYKDLYSVLSLQATRQIERSIGIDNEMIKYLFSLIKESTSTKTLSIKAENGNDNNYVDISVSIPNYLINQEQASNLFTPETTDVRFLICRQIVREAGEEQGARRCGVQAFLNDKGETIIYVTITKKLWINSKLLL